MITDALWIGMTEDFGDVCPEFKREFKINGKAKKVTLTLTAIGVYEARINGERVGDFILAPGLTAYEHRLQYQTYDITSMIGSENSINIFLGTGWYRGKISARHDKIHNTPAAIIAEIVITYADGKIERIISDESWSVRKSNILFSDIYDGEIFDARENTDFYRGVKVIDLPKTTLIPQEGEIVCEQERIAAAKYIVTPKGERVIDFGQNMAGYVEFSVDAKAGDKVSFVCGEVLDADGNFYNENYREAEARLEYYCKDGFQTYKPRLTFFGFRYIKLEEYPCEVKCGNFTAVALCSKMHRTGYIKTANAKINQLISNTLWSQRSNFIDIPTDCPQRSERMGWSGDAQLFAETAAYNFDVKKFFEKWINDICAEQFENGGIPEVIPNLWNDSRSSAAWSDVITIVPWTMYKMYGDKTVLEKSFDAMRRWVDYITNDTLDEYLWTCPDERKKLWGKHYGDWLALDAEPGSWKGATNDDFIASAYYAISTDILVNSGNVLGKDVSQYEKLYKNIVRRFKEYFPNLKTQTDHVIAICFGLTDNKEEAAKTLAELVRKNGNRFNTGFVGTPYIMQALSDNGYADVAYDLLLQEAHPSWLYEVNHGATTIWEHWDSIKEDGTMWDKGMNSFNHYTFGAVVGWLYSRAAGIKPSAKYAGFERLEVAPTASGKLGSLDCRYETPRGEVVSKWVVLEDKTRYEITVPTEAKIVIDDKEYDVSAGSYIFWGEKK